MVSYYGGIYHRRGVILYTILCVHIYIYVCMYMYIYIYIYTCMHACMHAYIHTYIHTYMPYVRTYTSMYMCVRIRWGRSHSLFWRVEQVEYGLRPWELWAVQGHCSSLLVVLVVIVLKYWTSISLDKPCFEGSSPSRRACSIGMRESAPQKFLQRGFYEHCDSRPANPKAGSIWRNRFILMPRCLCEGRAVLFEDHSSRRQ